MDFSLNMKILSQVIKNVNITSFNFIIDQIFNFLIDHICFNLRYFFKGGVKL